MTVSFTPYNATLSFCNVYLYSHYISQQTSEKSSSSDRTTETDTNVFYDTTRQNIHNSEHIVYKMHICADFRITWIRMPARWRGQQLALAWKTDDRLTAITVKYLARVKKNLNRIPEKSRRPSNSEMFFVKNLYGKCPALRVNKSI